MDIDEEIDVRIVMELHTIHVTVPAKWSINKLKCLVVTLVPVFEFDAFAIAHRSYLLRGDYKLKDLRCGRNI